jgi:hypothetical protein
VCGAAFVVVWLEACTDRLHRIAHTFCTKRMVQKTKIAGSRYYRPTHAETPAPASFGTSSIPENPLEGVAFCRKGVSVLRPLDPPILGTPCLKIHVLHSLAHRHVARLSHIEAYYFFCARYASNNSLRLPHDQLSTGRILEVLEYGANILMKGLITCMRLIPTIFLRK